MKRLLRGNHSAAPDWGKRNPDRLRAGVAALTAALLLATACSVESSPTTKADPAKASQQRLAKVENRLAAIEQNLAAIERDQAERIAAIAPAALAHPSPVVEDAAPAAQFGLHMASYHQLDSIAPGWHALWAKNPDLLDGLRPVVAPAEIGEAHEHYYRLKAVGFASADAAHAACVELQARDQYCAVADAAGIPAEQMPVN